MAEFLHNQMAVETALDGCPDPSAGRAIFVAAGYETNICHQFRDDSGNPIDLQQHLADAAATATTTTADPEATTTTGEPNCIHKAYFADAMCVCSVKTAPMRISEDETGRVCFDIPTSVSTKPGVYQIEMVVGDIDGNPYVRDTTLLSVEPSLYNRLVNPGGTSSGPITLGQVRTQLRDFAGLNTYWQNVEFSDAEIVHALIEPIRCFNEMLPQAISFNASNFPYRHNWLQATCACLLRISANSYMRNSRKITYGDGKTQDDRDKYATYAQLAETKWLEYKQFCVQEQVVANWHGSYHTARYY